MARPRNTWIGALVALAALLALVLGSGTSSVDRPAERDDGPAADTPPYAPAPALASAGTGAPPAADAPAAGAVPAPPPDVTSAPPPTGTADVRVIVQLGAPAAAGADDHVVVTVGDVRREAPVREGKATVVAVPWGPAEVTLRSHVLIASPVAAVVGAAGTDVTLLATGGSGIVGRVVDAASGAPVASARVTTYLGGAFGSTRQDEDGPPLVPATSTDADGRFATAAVRWDSTVTVDVVAPGYLRWRGTTRQQRTGAAESLDVRLGPGVSLAGTVVDDEGAPVAGAAVYVMPSAWADVRRDPRRTAPAIDAGSHARRADEALSEADGRFVVHGLRADVEFCATARTRSGRRSPDVCGLVITAGGPVPRARLVLSAGGALEVRLLDPAGRAVVGGSVFVGRELVARTTLDGVARFPELATGRVDVRVLSDAGIAEPQDVHVHARTTTSETIRLQTGHDLRGTVVDDAGEPVARATVSCEGPLGWPLGYATTVADPLGRFELRGLRAGKVRIDAHAPGMSLERTVDVEVPGKPARIALTRKPGVVIRLILPTGAPEPATVKLIDQATDRSSGSQTQRPFGLGPAPWYPRHGRRALTWIVPGYAPVDRDVDVAETGVLDLGDAILDVGVTLPGVVVDPDGRPVSGAEIRGRFWEREPMQTAQDGTFRIEHERRAPIAIGVDARGFLSTWLEHDPQVDGPTVRVVLARGGVVRGRVRPAAEGASATAAILDASGRAVTTTEVSPGGDFDLRARPGTYVLEVRGPTGPWLRRDIELVEGAVVAVDVTPPR